VKDPFFGMKLLWKWKAQVNNIMTFIEELPVVALAVIM
jgi:hypothetical protein